MIRSLRAAVAIAGAALLATPLFAETITRPNTVKYADNGMKNASGRAGDTTLESRVLLNSDSTTTIELTTSSFENNDPAAGTITRMQLKVGGETLNFNNLDAGGTFTTTLDGLSAGAPLQIQAHVRHADLSGTGVITVNEVVKLRPDLSVTALAPVHTWLGFPTRISGLISELNGDVGARANCRLLVDGSEVDRAEGIWVDAGDSVQCSFAYEFETVGQASLQIVVDSVNPGDWDDANNSATATLTVYADDSPFYNWTIQATEKQTDEYRYTKNDDYELTRYQSGPTRSIRFDGNISRNVLLDNVQVSTRVETDGVVLHDVPSVEFPFAPFVVGPNRRLCRSSEPGPVRATLCYDLPGRFKRNDFTNVQVEFGASDITYRSWGYNKLLAPQNPGDPYYIFDEYRGPTGDFIPLGNTLSVEIVVSDGTELWRATPFISSFTNSENHVNNPYRCFVSSFSGYTCQEYRLDEIIRSGSASSN